MRFVEITSENWQAAIDLKLDPSQEHLLHPTPVLYSLAKCYIVPGKYVPYAIEHNGQLVGAFRFRNYGHGVNLVAFFIDHRYQRQGLARMALQHFLQWVQANHPAAKEVEIWVAPNNIVARRLYEGFGFHYTGQTSKSGDLYLEFHFPNTVPA